jgi:Protein of unknown function (DUF2750)
MVKAPARDPSDFGIAHSAEPALFMPEKTKRTSTPKRILHMGSFALFEVGFIDRVVGVRVTFDFNVSLDGCAILNSAVCAFYDIRVKPGAGVSADELSADKLISIQFTTPDLLNSGIWALVAQFVPTHLERMTWLPALEKVDFVGATVRGSGIMMEFLSAFYGLSAWDDYADPAYFDKLLLTQDKKPSRLILTRICQRLRTRANKISQAAAQAHVFYREVARTGKLWTVRDQGGFPQPMTNDGYRAQPFWSSLSRVQRIVKNVPA